jgi:hypothetical protein
VCGELLGYTELQRMGVLQTAGEELPEAGE